MSPAALGKLEADPARSADRFSASYPIALAARIVREVGALWHRARANDRRLATLSIDAVIRLKSPEDRAAFTKDLSRADLSCAIAGLAARYHDERSPGGRAHRLIVASYPAPRAAAERTCMPIKKNADGRRSVEMEIVVPGTPEEVWHAMATGPGNTGWFTRTTTDGRVGGEIAFDFGAHGTQKGEVTGMGTATSLRLRRARLERGRAARRDRGHDYRAIR